MTEQSVWNTNGWPTNTEGYSSDLPHFPNILRNILPPQVLPLLQTLSLPPFFPSFTSPFPLYICQSTFLSCSALPLLLLPSAKFFYDYNTFFSHSFNFFMVLPDISQKRTYIYSHNSLYFPVLTHFAVTPCLLCIVFWYIHTYILLQTMHKRMYSTLTILRECI